VRFYSSGIFPQLTPFGLMFHLLHFFRILFRVCQVIRIRNSSCAMGHCGEPNFFTDAWELKLGWYKPWLLLFIYIDFLSITAPFKDMASF
jgi:hypothetical protein